jgi:hypothetical protein
VVGTETAKALDGADRLLKELTGEDLRREGPVAPTMGRLQKVSYTHDAMIEFIIAESARPGGISQKQIAEYFGYTEAWVSNILASDAFQMRLDNRRKELIDPELAATIKERFQALVIQSLKVLQQQLNKTEVSPNVALRCAELGAKALGVGGHSQPPPAPSQDRLLRLAERLVVLQAGVRARVGETIDGETGEIIKEGGSV